MTEKKSKKENMTKVKNDPTIRKTRSATARDASNPTLPSAEDLKARFKAGSVPTEADFNDLIELANAGAEATGQAPGQTGPGAGLRLSETGQLELNLDSHDFTGDTQGYSPVMLNSAAGANNIVVDLYQGLTHVEHHGLSVKPGNGVTVDDNGVSVIGGSGITVVEGGFYVKPGNGISVDDNGVNVSAGEGITVDLSGVNVKTGDGIGVNYNGIKVKLGWYTGLEFDDAGNLCLAGIKSHDFTDDYFGCSPVMVNSANNQIVVDLYKGLVHVEDQGLAIKAMTGSGIEVDEDGVKLKLSPSGELAINESGELHLKKTPALEAMFTDTKFPAGMVTAFHGTELPEGWALCDGENNTPDLRTMFISTDKDNMKNSDNVKIESFQLVYIIKK